MRHGSLAVLCALAVGLSLALSAWSSFERPAAAASSSPPPSGLALPDAVTAPPLLALPESPAFDTTVTQGQISYFMHVPANAVHYQPLQVLVALHGMRGNGASICTGLFGAAERNHWVVLAPNLDYGDWRNPSVLSEEDLRLSELVRDAASVVALQLKLQVRPKVLLFGFSRGAQLADRTAFFYPRSVAGVVSLSAGTYTLPQNTSEHQPAGLKLPFGVSDLAARVGHPLDLQELSGVKFFVGVGAGDARESDLPRQWDYLGKNRVQRAESFERALERAGIPVTLTLFPRGGHEITVEMRDAGLSFLEGIARSLEG